MFKKESKQSQEKSTDFSMSDRYFFKARAIDWWEIFFLYNLIIF